jgi:hypothetical protein
VVFVVSLIVYTIGRICKKSCDEPEHLTDVPLVMNLATGMPVIDASTNSPISTTERVNLIPMSMAPENAELALNANGEALVDANTGDVMVFDPKDLNYAPPPQQPTEKQNKFDLLPTDLMPSKADLSVFEDDVSPMPREEDANLIGDVNLQTTAGSKKIYNRDLRPLPFIPKIETMFNNSSYIPSDYLHKNTFESCQ